MAEVSQNGEGKGAVANYRIGTRGSKLALIQTEFVKRRLEAAYPEDTFEIVTIRTKGDVVTDRPIAAIGDSALFTREIENALRDGRIDLAVHSMKDLAAECPPGLTLAKAWTREDPRDALVARDGVRSIEDLPRGAVVATGSVRRTALLRRMRPDLDVVDIRGNVDTRLRKLFDPKPDEPRLDAVVLAVAGLKRLGRDEVISQRIPEEQMIPACNQGQLAIELRASDAELKAKVDALGDDAAEAVACAERLFLRENGSDCRRPVGAVARIEKGVLTMSCVSGTDETDLVFSRRTAGAVTLVGAGPGDPELVTVKGLKAIREADAIVYDRLATDALLEEAKPDCERIYVGKASGRHTLPQAEINALLMRLALVHRRVVRLKGGDPFVFGRGGEEMAYLTRVGVPCRTIPGVSSAVAAAEAVRIPVTHRGVASAFEVVTAHARDGEALALDFSRMQDERRTYVFLMGLARVGEIAAGLMAAGRSAGTLAAVVSAATTPEERCVTGTLADIGARTAEAGLASPAVLVVGAVVGLRRELGLPLAGGRFLVPVIEGGTAELAARIRELGGWVDEVTVGRIVKIDGALRESDLDGVDRIVLTSRNGWLGLGDGLKAAAASRGIRIEAVRKVEPVGRTLHLTQPEAERVAGVRSVDVYRNEAVPIRETIDLSKYDAVFFTCASSVRRLCACSVGSTVALAIGPKTAAALAGTGHRVVTAAAPDLDSLLTAACMSLTIGAIRSAGA